jgi:putative ABC transport system substrate-binding protein
MQLTRSIPIILPGASDPVGVGYIESLARPGGNVTGFGSFDLSLVGKWLGTLKQIAPSTSRVAIIYNPDNSNTVLYRRLSDEFARQLAIEPISAPIHGLADVDSFATKSPLWLRAHAYRRCIPAAFWWRAVV